MRISVDFDHFQYYGMGPVENYIDRIHGAKLGVFGNNVTNNLSKYVVPQESGNRTGVRWAKILDRNGFGLQFNDLQKPF